MRFPRTSLLVPVPLFALAICAASCGDDGSDGVAAAAQSQSSAPEDPGPTPPAAKVPETDPAIPERSPDPETDYCTYAYRSYLGMLRQGAARPAGSKIASEEEFRDACGQLPQEVQRCMVVGYAVRHQAQCQEVQSRVDPKLVARIRAMMAPPPSP